MPSSPSSLPSALVLLFAVACGLSVANVYYAQPLLDVLGAEFAIGQAGVGLLFGATQAGCALALLRVVPLGDLLERRRLMFVQLLLLVLSLLLVGFAGDTLGLALGLLGLGLLGTAMTQGLLAYAAALLCGGEISRPGVVQQEERADMLAQCVVGKERTNGESVAHPVAVGVAVDSQDLFHVGAPRLSRWSDTLVPGSGNR